MANLQYWMDYTIFVSDPADYATLLALADGNGLIKMAPRTVAGLIGIPYPYASGDVSNLDKQIMFYSPYTPGAEIGFPEPTGVHVDDSVLTLGPIPGQAGTPPSIWPAGPGAVFTWSGNILLTGTGQAPATRILGAISQRRWMGGRELSNSGEGTGPGNSNFSRDFSRTVDGVGWGIRQGATNLFWNRNHSTYRTGLNPPTGWERFYIRFRRLPASLTETIYQSHGFPSAGCGFQMTWLPSGLFRVAGTNSGGTPDAGKDVFTPVLNTWYKIDIIYKMGGSSSTINFYINGTFIVQHISSTAVGSYFQSSEISHGGSTDTETEVDFDDWSGMDVPSNFNTTSMTFNDANYPLDWLVGTHCRVHRAISATHASYTPAGAGVGVCNEDPAPTRRLGSAVLTSSTSGAQVEALTDALTQDILDTYAVTYGVASAIVSANTTNASGTDGSLGYKKAGGSATLTVINEVAGETNFQATYNIATPVAMTLPDEVAPWSMVYQKSADAAVATLGMMQTVMEYIGVWGPEDDPTGQFQLEVSRNGFLHNARYMNSIYGYFGSQPQAGATVFGGTYTGNGGYQEITLPDACHFLMIAPANGAAGGGPWWLLGASYQAHNQASEQTIPNIRMWYDIINGVFKFGVTGAASSPNTSGTVFQYVAFCDPGMRFCIGGCFFHGSGTSTPKVNLLCDPSFTPDAAFLQREITTASAVQALFYRGPGNAANDASLFGGAPTVNVASFAAGLINSYAALHTPQTSTTYLAFRTSDSGGACSTNVMVQILSYTGNGSNPRNITLTPTSGRFPLLVIVAPATVSGSSFFRTPTHTGSNSGNCDTNSNSTTAITGTAVDQITVNTSLNVNGTVYNVFALCGDVTNSNGEFAATYCDGGGPYVDPTIAAGINVVGNGGLLLDGTTQQTVLKDISGIYTLIPGQRHDSLIDRQTGQTSVDVKIPDPTFKTGYVGG